MFKNHPVLSKQRAPKQSWPSTQPLVRANNGPFTNPFTAKSSKHTHGPRTGPNNTNGSQLPHTQRRGRTHTYIYTHATTHRLTHSPRRSHAHTLRTQPPTLSSHPHLASFRDSDDVALAAAGGATHPVRSTAHRGRLDDARARLEAPLYSRTARGVHSGRVQRPWWPDCTRAHGEDSGGQRA